jgi:16S rRNA (guanine966-N2)-methyltransferase
MGRLRIIAGELKGRRLAVVDEPGLRPTSDRVREALFSILAGRPAGARVLDAYAGTGALGFEALSRGARHAIFVDSSRSVVRALERSRADLGCLDRSRVVEGDVVTLLNRGALAGPFDLVFADPPYGAGEHDRFLEALGRHTALVPEGLLVLEQETKKNQENGSDPAGFVRVRREVYGRAALNFFEVLASG